jgi:two-component system response regulator PilR (NtrC family)
MARELSLTPQIGLCMRVWNEKTVLVVDDEPDICFLFENILRKRNLRSGFARNLAEASSLIADGQPDLIFLDNSLPDGRGIDFIPFLREQCPDTRIIVVTANDSPSDEQAAFVKGAHAFLGKPLTLDRINKTLDRMMVGHSDSPVL